MVSDCFTKMRPAVVVGAVLDFLDSLERKIKEHNAEGFTLEWVNKVRAELQNNQFNNDLAVAVFLAGRWYDTILFPVGHILPSSVLGVNIEPVEA